MLASQMTQRLFLTRSFEEAIHTILDDTIALLGAEYGNIQLAIGDELVIAAQRGLSADFLKTFRRVKKVEGLRAGGPCGLAKRSSFVMSKTIPNLPLSGRTRRKPGFARSRVRRSVPKTETCWGWCPRILHMLMSRHQLRCRR